MACIKNGGLGEFGAGKEIDLLSSSYAVQYKCVIISNVLKRIS